MYWKRVEVKLDWDRRAKMFQTTKKPSEPTNKDSVDDSAEGSVGGSSEDFA